MKAIIGLLAILALSAGFSSVGSLSANAQTVRAPIAQQNFIPGLQFPKVGSAASERKD